MNRGTENRRWKKSEEEQPAGLSGWGEAGRREQWCEAGRSGPKWGFLGGEE